MGSRGFSAGLSGIGGQGGVFGRQLEHLSQQKGFVVREQSHYMASVSWKAYWFQREDAGGDDEQERDDKQES